VNNVTFLPWVDPPEATPGELMPTAGNVVTPLDDNRDDSRVGDADIDVLVVDGAEIDGLEFDETDGEISSPDVETALLRALTRRDMSEREVRAWLSARDVAENDAEEWIERMQRLGYVDDLRMATHLVDKLVARGGKGRGVIVQKLTERGIDRGTASEAVSHLDDDSQQQQATELAVARASRMGTLTDEAARRRLHGFLARRGYSSTVIREAVHHALRKPG
jgi:SOS response regulatory protein OraA/RecX